MSAHSAGYQAGQFVGYFIPLAIGVAVSLYLRKKRGGDKVPGWPIAIGLALSLLSCVSMQKPGQGSAGDTSRANVEDSNEVDLYVGVTEGDFPDRIDPAVLRQFQQDVTRNLEAQYSEKLGSIESTISTTRMGGKTIITYEALGNLGPRVSQYVGVVKGRRNVVTCVSPSGKPFEECLAKAAEVFGKP